ncbi:MAG: hypothetical protein NTW29_14265 [Bacteroidetes bacterium]|nr:hypothetical protein [Bacteroidota bacterium]
MQFIFSDTEGHEALHTDTSFLLEVLSRPYTDWQSGTGDNAIQMKDDERLIFFKTEQGVFIMQHPDYLAPLIQKNNSNANPITHYVGGEPMEIPPACMCNEQIAFEILKNYIVSGGLPDKSYTWVEFTELIQD